MPTGARKEFSFPPLPEELDEGLKTHLLVLEEILREVSMIASGTTIVVTLETDNWRFVESGESLLLQKNIANVWTTIGEWSE